MAHNIVQPQYILAQPQAHGVFQGDPFKQLQSEWTVGLCDCCNDISQCKSFRLAKTFLKKRFVGCFAYFCWYCFVGSLAKRIDESALSCCFVPNALSIYRMKIRSVLKIQVRFVCESIRLVCFE